MFTSKKKQYQLVYRGSNELGLRAGNSYRKYVWIGNYNMVPHIWLSHNNGAIPYTPIGFLRNWEEA